MPHVYAPFSANIDHSVALSASHPANHISEKPPSDSKHMISPFNQWFKNKESPKSRILHITDRINTSLDEHIIFRKINNG